VTISTWSILLNIIASEARLNEVPHAAIQPKSLQRSGSGMMRSYPIERLLSVGPLVTFAAAAAEVPEGHRGGP